MAGCILRLDLGIEFGEAEIAIFHGTTVPSLFRDLRHAVPLWAKARELSRWRWEEAEVSNGDLTSRGSASRRALRQPPAIIDGS